MSRSFYVGEDIRQEDIHAKYESGVLRLSIPKQEEKLDFVEQYAIEHGTFSFKKMLEGQKSKMQIVVTFLAILELMKMGKIVIRQEATFADIMITSAHYHKKNV